jgi:hypothetical protein
MNNDRYGQAVGRDQSKEIASKYTPYEAFLTKLEELDVYSHQACMQLPKEYQNVT